MPTFKVPKYCLSDVLCCAAVTTLDGPSLHLPQIQTQCEPEHLKMLSARDVSNMFTPCINMHFFLIWTTYPAADRILTPGCSGKLCCCRLH